MPKRMVDTEIWTDERFSELTAEAKLVYLRLVVGPETNYAGATRIPERVLAASLLVPQEAVRDAIGELESVGLLRRYEAWVWMPTWIRYQCLSKGFRKGARRAMRGLPDALQKAIDRTLSSEFGEQKNGAVDKDTFSPTVAEAPTGKAATSREDMVGNPQPTPSQPPASGKGAVRGIHRHNQTDLKVSQSGGVREDDAASASAGSASGSVGDDSDDVIEVVPMPDSLKDIRKGWPTDGQRSEAEQARIVAEQLAALKAEQSQQPGADGG